MNTLLVAATSALLFVAPFAGSAGLRATLLFIIAGALAWQARSLRAAWDAAPRPVVFAFAAWVVLALASLAWSADRGYTLGELRAEVLYATLALAGYFLAAFQDGSRWRLWSRALVAGAATMACWFLVQELLPFTLPKHTLLEQRGPWSTHLVMVAPVLLVLCGPAPWGEGRRATVQAIALAALLAAAWATGNRVIWLALAVQLVVVMALARNVRRLALAATLAVTLAFAASLHEHNERFFGGEAPLATSFERDLRPKIWSAAMDRILEAPWLGHGYGREIVAGSFAPLTPPKYPELRHAHNVFLDVAIELGVVGLAVFVALLVALAREYRACLARPGLVALGVMGLALLAGFVVKSLTDDFLYRHNALVFWALNGILLGLARTPRPPPREATEPQ
ncbi:MAG TPA: O-antigen ligase family protein [Usitatibacter sp.]|jgi:O-antigen ligase|nr:O-antigen ligase family protein [Usitatibacter sp.]